jgi:CRISPR-associated protein Csx16
MTTFFISRHPGAIVWAAQQSLLIDQHLTHLDTALIQHGDTVIGTLPVNLAAAVCQRGARFFNLSLDLPAHWRGRELSASELRQCNARLEGFDIRSHDLPLEQLACQGQA